MKVILLRDVAKIGKRYQIVEVPDGFALNKLIPQKDAEAATPVNVKRVTNMRQKGLSDKEGIAVAIKKMITDLSDSPLQVLMQANEQGHLFKSVHADDVAVAAAMRGVKIPKEFVSISSPIKSTGEHSIVLKSQGETATLVIFVVAK
jgi:large subunit ribosomal protein L9